jgi:hypothetical protein
MATLYLTTHAYPNHRTLPPQIIKECKQKKKAGHIAYGSLSQAIGTRLRLAVGDEHWKVACQIHKKLERGQANLKKTKGRKPGQEQSTKKKKSLKQQQQQKSDQMMDERMDEEGTTNAGDSTSTGGKESKDGGSNKEQRVSFSGDVEKV